MRKSFKEPGGRLFRIALIFTLVSVIAIGLMTWLTHIAMADMKELGMAVTPMNTTRVDVIGFFVKLIDSLNIGGVISALSAVLIAIAARYGLRETSKNIGDGLAGKSQQKGPDAPQGGSSSGSAGGTE